MRVALFITCFNDMMFIRTGHMMTELLEQLGHSVEFPQGQTCCGQMHFNTGCRPETLPMVFRGGFRGLRRRGPPFRLQRGTRHHPARARCCPIPAASASSRTGGAWRRAYSSDL